MFKPNQLAKKKRRNFDEAQDYFLSTKRYKKYVQFNDHQVGIMLNEPITLHCPRYFPYVSSWSRVDDLARTLSSFLLAKVGNGSTTENEVPKERVSIQLGWKCQAERCRSHLEAEQIILLLEVYKAGKLCFMSKGKKQISLRMTSSKLMSSFKISCSGSTTENEVPKERVSIQLGWKCQAERCRSHLEAEQIILLLEVYKAGKLCFMSKGKKQISLRMTSSKLVRKYKSVLNCFLKGDFPIT
ncbi:hypothetical protein Tco_0004327 [Tanacetum coccineum]